ncbi:PREDICTED: angiopoietin-4 [Chinchilla lanigera]|uniref:angiopoietin-4 n=1 Tax=Chinchilla lanigera TaxID=34839 RepID=UPI0006972351|nr:PREDICTED: angiopoietin-4 [Chinchilla lanigera]
MTTAQKKGQQALKGKVQYQFKNGQCSYTFWVPELQPCSPESPTLGPSYSTQKNQSLTIQMRLLFTHQMEKLENALRNSTQRLEKLEENIQTILRTELQQAQQNIVQKHTGFILELGTSLLAQTTAQTLKLTNMEAQVLNQTLNMEKQMLEMMQTTEKLGKQMQEQNHTLHHLHGHNRPPPLLLLGAQPMITSSSRPTPAWLIFSSLHLLTRDPHTGEQEAGSPPCRADEHVFQDCEDICRSGVNQDGVYTIRIPNLNKTKRVFCVMDTDGGAWTVIQRRENGTVNFQRNWQDYKQGFGHPAGEHWLGNEAVHQLTSSAKYSLRLEMEDWDGNTSQANFKHFQLGSKEEFYKIFVNGYSGEMPQLGNVILWNNTFSTHDADHDNCGCNCAQIMSGGWWFDSCGGSNLNGIYYPAGQHLHKINGIRWNFFRGTTYSLRATRMMMRPLHS